jgi:hypothetical protein
MSAQRRNKTAAARVLAGTAAVLAFLAAGGCRFGIPDYTLTVVVEEGVAGTPEAGEYTHQELTAVEYSYLPVNSLHTVEVLLNDSIRTSGTGSLVMYGDGYELRARLIDLRGAWKMKLAYDDTTIAAPGEFTVTLSGTDITGGTFTDSRGASGSWTALSGVVILSYADWFDYVLTGSVYTMQGVLAGEELTGSWTATRQE